ncbi:MAG: sulfatase [Fidelibacterota bacterium]
MKKIILFSAAVLMIAACSRESRPNIIFIMTDDHAEKAISAYDSSLIKTPNIDRLATEGVRFSNSYVTNSICAPSRAVLLTGKYSHMNGQRDNRDVFDGGQMTFPKLLQEAGYQTAMIGKWHLKSTPTGFDDWRVLRGQGRYYNPLFIENGDTVKYEGYTTDIITDMVIDFLQKRDKDKPFCMLYHHKAPHRNWMPAGRHIGAFADREFQLPATFYDDYSTREKTAGVQDMEIKDMLLGYDMKIHFLPGEREMFTGGSQSINWDGTGSWKNVYNALTPSQKQVFDSYYDKVNEEYRNSDLSGKALEEWKFQRYMEDYLGCILSVDENIGRLLDYLDEQGLAENTIVVYTSDQGFYLGEHGWYDKRFMYEESFSMPLLVRYPEKIRPGSVNEEFVLNLDFAPTFLDYAGVEIPEEIQGTSMRSLFEDQKSEPWRESVYYHYYAYPAWHDVHKHDGVRNKDYKLINFYDIDVWELYDLHNDPHELHNVYGDPAYEDVRKEMKAEYERLRKEFKVE